MKMATSQEPPKTQRDWILTIGLPDIARMKTACLEQHRAAEQALDQSRIHSLKIVEAAFFEKQIQIQKQYEISQLQMDKVEACFRDYLRSSDVTLDPHLAFMKEYKALKVEIRDPSIPLINIVFASITIGDEAISMPASRDPSFEPLKTLPRGRYSKADVNQEIAQTLYHSWDEEEVKAIITDCEMEAENAMAEYQYIDCLHWKLRALHFLQERFPSDQHTINSLRDLQEFNSYYELIAGITGRQREIPFSSKEFLKKVNFFGNILIKTKQYERAEEVLSANIDAGPSEHRMTTLYLLGRLHRKLHETERAMLELRECIEIGKVHFPHSQWMALAHIQIMKAYLSIKAREDAQKSAELAVLCSQDQNSIAAVKSLLALGALSYSSQAECEKKSLAIINKYHHMSKWQTKAKNIHYGYGISMDSYRLGKRRPSEGLDFRKVEMEYSSILETMKRNLPASQLTAALLLEFGYFYPEVTKAKEKYSEAMALMLQYHPTSQYTAEFLRNFGEHYGFTSEKELEEQYPAALSLMLKNYGNSKSTAAFHLHYAKLNAHSKIAKVEYSHAVFQVLGGHPTSQYTAELITDNEWLYHGTAYAIKEKNYSHAVSILTQNYPTSIFTAFLLREFASFYERTKPTNWEKAEQNYSAAANLLYEHHPAASYTITQLQQLSKLYADQGNTEKELELLSKTAFLMTKYQNSSTILQIYEKIGRAYNEKYDLRQAEAQFTRASLLIPTKSQRSHQRTICTCIRESYKGLYLSCYSLD